MANMIKQAWNSKGAGIAAAIVLALVVLVVIVAIVLSFVAPAKPGAQAPQESTAAQSPSAEPAKDSAACSVPAGDTSFRPKIPADLRWQAAQGLAWPTSGSVGPTKTRDGFPVCFARSPLGAALFGLTVMNEQYKGHSPAELLKFYVAESPGKEVALKLGGTGGSAADTAAAGITPAGFITDSFTPDEAQVTLVLASPGTETGYTGMPFTYLWVDGDWRLKVLDSGKPFAGTVSAPVKGQFVEWRQ
ncbi:hypothetical protein AB0P28_14830 [Pseudarthrobacter sp. NPDC089323]